MTKEKLQIPIKIIDVRQSYGRIDLRIVPIHGAGVIWVSHKRVKIEGGK